MLFEIEDYLSVSDKDKCYVCNKSDFKEQMLPVESEHGERTAYFCTDECYEKFMEKYTR